MLTTLFLLLTCYTAHAGAEDLAASPDRRGGSVADQQVAVRLERVDPAIATPRTATTVSGTVHNTGTATLAGAVVQVRVAGRGLDTRAAVAQWADGSSTITSGEVVAAAALEGPLAPGGTRAFEATIDPGAVEPPFAFATLPMSVDVIGTAAGGDRRLGSLRTFLPWDLGGDFRHHPIDLGWLVPLTLPADPDLFAADAEQRAAAWEEAVGPDSPIQRVMDGLEDAPVTWVVDPTVLSPRAPSDPVPAEPEGRGEPGTTPPDEPGPTEPGGTVGDRTTDGGANSGSGTQPPVGAPPGGQGGDGGADRPADEPGDDSAPLTAGTDALLGRLIDARGSSPLWALPSADPDVSALLELDPDSSVLAELVAAGPALAPDGARTDIAWPVAGVLDAERIGQLRAAWSGTETGLSTVVLPSTALHQQDRLVSSAVRRGPGEVSLLTYDRGLSAMVNRATEQDTGGAVVQRLLAETLAIFQERPAEDRSLLLAPARGIDSDPQVLAAMVEAMQDAPWLRQVSATSLLARGPSPASPPAVLAGSGEQAPPAPGEATEYPGPSPLSRERLLQVEQTGERVRGVAAILSDEAAFVDRWHTVHDQLYSTRWRGDPDGWARLHEGITEAVADVSHGLAVSPSTVNFFADEGVLQVTVVNDLAVAVQDVQLELVPGNGRLRIVAQPEPIDIGPESRTTVRFPVEAVAAGQVPVEARLSTPNGTTLSEPEDLLVRVQPTSTWIYWVLGIVAGLILVLGLYRTLRPHGDRAAATDPTPSQETLSP